MHDNAFDYDEIAAGKVAQILFIPFQFADIIEKSMLRVGQVDLTFGIEKFIGLLVLLEEANKEEIRNGQNR